LSFFLLPEKSAELFCQDDQVAHLYTNSHEHIDLPLCWLVRLDARIDQSDQLVEDRLDE
jgi:hypothetical protein